MTRIRTALALAFAIAPLGAAAATLTIQLDQATYNPGDIITMTILGDSQGAQDIFAYGQIEFSPVAVLGASAVVAVPPSDTVGVTWLQGGLTGNCNLTTCIMINMIPSAVVSLGVDPLSEPFVYGTVTATAGAPGVYPIFWNTTGLGFELGFFGLTDAPAASLVIVPEPATGALLALGLVALARARRRSA